MNEMEERLARIETLLETLTNRVMEHQTESTARSARLERTVFGDGNGYKGMVVRLDRLEQDLERRLWRERALTATVFGLLAKAAFDLFQGGV